MLSEERKSRVLQMIETNGIVHVQRLADIFNVSIYTIRRDLSDLEKKGVIKKTHGGAVRIEKSVWLPTIEEGEKEAVAEKRAIALKAADYIEDGDTIFLMGSTITNMMLPLINKKRLTVVTNSLDVAKSLSSYENIETIIIGGKVKNYKGNILGSSAITDVDNFYFDKAFVQCAGVQSGSGITTSTIETADFTRAVIHNTRQNILTADYRKIGRITFSKICDIACINILITDNKADENELERISKKNIIVHTVNVPN